MISSLTVFAPIDTLSTDIPTPEANLGWFTYILQGYLDDEEPLEVLRELAEATM